MSAEDQNDDDFTLAPQEVVKDKDGEATRLTNPSTVRPEDRNEDDFALAPQEVAEDERCEATRAAVAPASSSKRIGPYKLLQQIGEGGMGAVWMAQQDYPVRRRVALKLVKDGMDSRAVVARFEAERQALAMMAHQNIAKILDAGTSDTGQPFFVMELVQGVPITEYCNNHCMTTEERLKLFVPVCAAIQHAHQKGIIHRDLKPSNVLVGIEDGKPVPKVIDFGLAKALQHQMQLTEKTMFTEYGQVVGTVQYMSPEQAVLDANDVDTRSDIYALGVLLYELLTGSTPLERDTIKQAPFLTVLSMIRDKEAQRPSDRVSTIGENVSNISMQRNTQPQRLKQALRGDLDWIVMKALDKDRERRFDNAGSFADDIRRYLSGEVIKSRPPTTLYRLRKFTKKNRGLVIATTLIGSLLLGGIAGTSWFAIKAESAREQAVNEKIRADQRTAEIAAEKKRADEKSKQALVAQQSANQANKVADQRLAQSTYLLAVARWQENDVRSAIGLLKKVPKKHRNFEWYLDRHLFPQSSRTVAWHGWVATQAIWNPNDQMIASVGWEKIVRVSDSKSGKQIFRLQIRDQESNFLAYSPLGDQMAVVSGKETTIVDTSSGEQKMKIEGAFKRVAFDIQGKSIIALGLNKAERWNITGDNPELIDAYTEHESTRQPRLAISPGGKQFVTCSSGGTVLSRDINTQQELFKFALPESILAAKYSPNGKELAIASGKRILIFDSATGEQLRQLIGHDNVVTTVDFSPDGKQLLSGSWDETIRLWETESCAEVRMFSEHSTMVESVQFSPDGTEFVSASRDKSVRIWKVEPEEKFLAIAGDAAVHGISFSPDGTLIASSSGNEVRLHDIAGQQIRSFKGHDKLVRSISFHPDGNWIASGGEDGLVMIWDRNTTQAVHIFQGHESTVTDVAWSPDGRLLATSSLDKSVRIWDPETGKEKHTLMWPTAAVNAIDFSPDGKLIAAASDDHRAYLWNPETGEKVHRLRYTFLQTTSVAFTPDGSELVSGTLDNAMLVWDPKTGKEKRQFFGQRGGISSLAFHPNGTRMASASSDKMIKLWDPQQGQELRTLTGHTDSVNVVCFSPDGSKLASGCSDGTIRIWNAPGAEAATR